MHIVRKVVGVLEVLAGFVFVLNTASDIQLGFGLVLIAVGLNQIFANNNH